MAVLVHHDAWDQAWDVVACGPSGYATSGMEFFRPMIQAIDEFMASFTEEGAAVPDDSFNLRLAKNLRHLRAPGFFRLTSTLVAYATIALRPHVGDWVSMPREEVYTDTMFVLRSTDLQASSTGRRDAVARDSALRFARYACGQPSASRMNLTLAR